MPPQPAPRQWLSIIGWVLLCMALVPAITMIWMGVLQVVGGCTGALGSGVHCTRFDFSSLLIAGEFVFILGIIFFVPTMIAALAVGIVGVIRRLRRPAAHPFLKEPYLYLLVVASLTLYLLWGGGLYQLLKLFS